MDNVNVIRTGFFAPDFSLPDDKGNMFKLKDSLKDCFVALCFCPGIENKETKDILKNLNSGLPNTASEMPVKVVVVIPEKINKIEKLKKDLNLDFTILSDHLLRVSNRYYVVNSESHKPSVYFTAFVVDDELIVRYRTSKVDKYSEFSFADFKKEISKTI